MFMVTIQNQIYYILDIPVPRSILLTDGNLAKEYIEKELIPYDRLTIMVLSDKQSPKLNVASFSKCRFRNGNPSSPHKIDHAHWYYESKTQLNDKSFKFYFKIH